MTEEMATGIRAALGAANEAFMAAFRRGDAAGLAALYTENGQVLPPNGDFVSGPEAIHAMWQSVMDMGVKGVRLEIIEAEDHGNTAIEVSRYALMDAEGADLDRGKYVVVWKQVGGQWKLHRDIFNSSLPTSGS
jgi:uncharacterized protein (TIGR02246 family)